MFNWLRNLFGIKRAAPGDRIIIPRTYVVNPSTQRFSTKAPNRSNTPKPALDDYLPIPIPTYIPVSSYEPTPYVKPDDSSFFGGGSSGGAGGGSSWDSCSSSYDGGGSSGGDSGGSCGGGD